MRSTATLLLAVTLGFYSTVPDPVLAQAQTVSFAAPSNYAVGTQPQTVAVGDFRGIGVQDLAVVNAGSNTVSVLLGNGDGTFQAARSYPVGLKPTSVAVSALRGTTVQDLVVANSGSTTVSVLLGNGDGTFQPARDFLVGNGPYFVAVGDFRGIGRKDLVTANFGSNTPTDNTISVLLGNGDGTFQPAQTYVADRGPIALGVGNFRGIVGRQDLVVVNYGSTTVSVLLGNGDGTFQPARNYPVGCSSGPCGAAVAVGDFRGTGIQDLAVAIYGDGTATTVSVLLGNGDGTFQAPQSYGVGPGPTSIATGDFRGIGRKDLVTANWQRNAGNTVSVLLGLGNGTFQAAQNFPTGLGVAGVAVGPFTRSGRQDLATANYNAGTVSVLLNTTASASGYVLTVNKAGTGTGTVTSSETPPSISCGPSCATASASYPSGTTVTLTASGASGSTFTGWSGGGCTGTGPCVVTMNGPTTVAATFTLQTTSYTLTVNKAGTGTGTVISSETPPSISCGPTCATASASYPSGTVVTLTASAASGSTFAGWTGGGCTGTGPCTVTMNASTTVSATFTVQTATYTLTVNKAGTGTGTVTSSETPPSISCGPTCATASASYSSGTSVTLTASPASGSTFASWSGCDIISGTTCTVTMNAAKSVTATFTMVQQQVATPTFSPAGGTYVGSVTVTLSTATSGATIHYTT
ncbi:MAG TPA: FG-GAP-like repeat-containing protein, partial [bacterium]|nr:FG-GAP-like repeat-containing protein [bacterium]